MSCLSRLFGLLCALIPGLGFLLFSLLLVGRWPELGLLKGAFYSVLSVITGFVCLYLGMTIVFARGQAPDSASPLAVADAHSTSVQATPQSILMETEPASAPHNLEAQTLDSPEARIRQLAQARPGLQVSAPQLAQLTNLNLGVAETTARAMAQNGEGVEMRAGDMGETIYVFH